MILYLILTVVVMALFLAGFTLWLLRTAFAPRRVGASTYDNLVQAVVWGLVLAGVAIGFTLYALALPAGPLPRMETIHVTMFGMALWITALAALHHGFKTKREWGS